MSQDSKSPYADVNTEKTDDHRLNLCAHIGDILRSPSSSLRSVHRTAEPFRRPVTDTDSGGAIESLLCAPPVLYFCVPSSAQSNNKPLFTTPEAPLGAACRKFGGRR